MPRAQLVALASWIGLILLTLAWEGWLAPAPRTAPGLWLMLKAIPLAILLRGLLHGRARAFGWAGLLAMLYLLEGLTIVGAQRHADWHWHMPAPYAALEVVLAVAFLIAATRFVRAQGRINRQANAKTE